VVVGEIWLKTGWTGSKTGWTGFHQGVFGSLADSAGDWTGSKFGWAGLKIRLNRFQIRLNRIQNSIEPVFQKSAHDFFWLADWQVRLWQRGTVQKPVEPVLIPVEPIFETVAHILRKLKWNKGKMEVFRSMILSFSTNTNLLYGSPLIVRQFLYSS
jgi:hypothetical protein